MIKQWTECDVSSFGESRAQQQTSLRKKIFDHKVSATHEAAVKIFADSQKETLEKVFLKTVSKEKEVTARVFRTAYKVAKENQSFNHFEAEIDVQELNGLDMGRILHSRNACANIITHISSEMKKQVVQEIVEGTDKFALIIDESTTLSKKSTLILYLRVCLKKLNMESPVNLFLDLMELENVTSRGIFNAVMKCLEGHKIDENVLKSRLVAFACDGAAVMLGGKSEVGVLLKEKFPSIVIWHCCNHRLELCVSDVVKKMASINRFKGFIDNLYVLYHASPKNSRELHVCADELGVQLLKIGRVLNTRWVASSFRTVSAVWENYEVLANHFAAAKVDQTRDPLERSKYEGLHRKLTSTCFILDLGLMCDALQELSDVSEELQHRDLDLFRANKKL
ncbi:E3 SUMO-protein ligase KIAA1586-like [Diabrotica virgifera virgifera]|uniref:E3 SUMO-protein ligase KIAA1586-like n=1 Tax=Diabrotica virgifera virgifera TaxID=50390 RepID=A0ABM5KCP1_DIAVI|nr:E3 SUMO-protein ligase KIAA1586-like [Diabrotica virgifera virgifera]